MIKKSYFEPYQKNVKFLVDKIELHSIEKLQANVTFYTVVSLAWFWQIKALFSCNNIIFRNKIVCFSGSAPYIDRVTSIVD